MAEGTETPTAAGAASPGPASSDLPPAVKIDVTGIATPFREEVRRAIKERFGGVGPKLVAFLANMVRAGIWPAWWWGIQADWTLAAAAFCWIDRIEGAQSPSRDVRIDVSAQPTIPIRAQTERPQDPYAKQYAEWTGKACEADGIRYELRIISENELEEQLYEANADPSVHGILIYYPVFGAWAGVWSLAIVWGADSCNPHPHTCPRLLSLLLRRLHGRLPARHGLLHQGRRCVIACSGK